MFEAVLSNAIQGMVVCGDCLDVMGTMPDGCADLIYADMIYDDFDFAWIDECARILKATGSIYVQTDYRSAAQVKLHLDGLLAFQNWIVWCYKICPQRQRRYQRKHDDIFFYTKSDEYIWNNPSQPPAASSLSRFRINDEGLVLNPSPSHEARGNYKYYVRPVICRDWWDDISIAYTTYDTPAKRKIHPYQKPEKLLERIIRASSNPGDIVVDPFIGSGTSAAVADRLGRRWIGCDIDPSCVKMALDRINQDRLRRSQLELPL